MKKFVSFFLMLTLFILVACSKNNGSPTDTAPSNLIVTPTVNPDNSGNVSFVATAQNTVVFTFDFGDGTAIQSAAAGTITYKYLASGTYAVTVTAKNSAGKSISKTVMVTIAASLSLVWSDEFNVDGAPDPTKWGYDTGAGGWGNNELEYYTNRPDNVIISGGTLKIIGKAESYNGSAYTSARILTKGKYSFKYGKIEVSAKLPGGAGTWPAIWMLGDNISTVGWPACGEADIMEMIGSQLNTIHGSLHDPTHYGGNSNTGSTVVPNTTTQFHKYAMEWSPSTIKYSVDDVVYYTYANNSTLPFNQNFFIILNFALGGNWPGAVDPAFTSATMEVDYVRVYQ